MADNYKISLGRFGEQLAADYIVSKGYKIIGRNVYTNHGEIDLIAEKGDEILFIEVKTRTSEDFGYPEEAVGARKISALMRAAKHYLNQRRVDKFWRFDVLAIELDKINRRAKIKWFKEVGRDRR